MSKQVKTLSDEVRATNRAMLQRGLAPVNPPRITDSVSAWRKTCMVMLGVMPRSIEPTRAEMLQAAGEVSGKLYEISGRDRGGRDVSRFYGNPAKVWEPFKQQPRRMVRIVKDPSKFNEVVTHYSFRTGERTLKLASDV